MPGLGLRTIGAAKTIPPREIEAEITVRLPRNDRMAELLPGSLFRVPLVKPAPRQRRSGTLKYSRSGSPLHEGQ